MQIGKLDQRITFQNVIETNDGGSLTKTWATSSPPDTVWAYVLSERGSESLQSAKINARETIRVLVRWRDDITPKHRLTWNGQIYGIKYVDKSNRGKGELWLTAELNGAL